MDARRFYVVRGTAPKGAVTYNCPTPDWALRKLRDFVAARYRNVTVTSPEGAALTEIDLVGIIDGPGAQPSDEAIPAAPHITRQPALV